MCGNEGGFFVTSRYDDSSPTLEKVRQNCKEKNKQGEPIVL